MARLLRSLGSWCARHGLVVIAIWALLGIGVGAAVTTFGAQTNNDLSLPGTDSQAAKDLLESRFPPQQNGVNPIVFDVSTGKLTDDDAKQAVSQSVKAIAAVPHVASVTDPVSSDGQTAGLLAEDGQTAFAPVLLDIGSGDLTPELAQQVVDATAPATRAGITVAAGGSVGSTLSTDDSEISEVVGIVAAMIILTLVLGSLVAMGMPIITAVVGLAVALGVVGLLGHAGPHPVQRPDARHDDRARRRHRLRPLPDHPPPGAPARRPVDGRLRSRRPSRPRAAPSCSRAAPSSSPCSRWGSPASRWSARSAWPPRSPSSPPCWSPSPCSPRSSDCSATGSPGCRCRRSCVRGAVAAPACGPVGPGVVRRHPAVVAVLSLAALVPLVIPALSLELGQEDVGATAPETTERQAYDLVTDGFGVGYNGPLQVASALDPVAAPSAAYTRKYDKAQSLKADLQQKQKDLTAQQKQLQRQQQQLEAQQQSLEDQQAGLEAHQASLERRADQLQAQQAGLERQAAALEAEQRRLEAELTRLKTEASALERRARAVAGRIRPLARELARLGLRERVLQRRIQRAEGNPIRVARLRARLVAVRERQVEVRARLAPLTARPRRLAEQARRLQAQASPAAAAGRRAAGHADDLSGRRRSLAAAGRVAPAQGDALQQQANRCSGRATSSSSRPTSSSSRPTSSRPSSSRPSSSRSRPRSSSSSSPTWSPRPVATSAAPTRAS